MQCQRRLYDGIAQVCDTTAEPIEMATENLLVDRGQIGYSRHGAVESREVALSALADGETARRGIHCRQELHIDNLLAETKVHAVEDRAMSHELREQGNGVLSTWLRTLPSFGAAADLKLKTYSWTWGL